MGAVIYALADNGVSDCCKIGKDTNWPRRFEQAQSHTPRGIQIVALWYVDVIEVRKAEKRATAELQKRRATPAIEWYDGPIDATIERVTASLDVSPAAPNGSPTVRGYDDWRSLPREDRGYRKRLWVHVEAGPRPRIKVIPSVLLDTAYQYTFTYNPWPVYLVAAYETSGGNGNHDANNKTVWQTWETLTAQLGSCVPSTSIGWLDDGVSFDAIDRFIRSVGLVPYDLGSPKPQDAPPRDSSVPRLDYGLVPPLRRVRSPREFFVA